MAKSSIDYEQLPGAVKHNLSPRQWIEAQREVVVAGDTVPNTTVYINLRNGISRRYLAGETADGDLLPTYNLSGARGKDDTQFETTPRNATADPSNP